MDVLAGLRQGGPNVSTSTRCLGGESRDSSDMTRVNGFVVADVAMRRTSALGFLGTSLKLRFMETSSRC